MPENINLAPVLIPIVALILGWVIGFFDSNNRAAKKIKEAEQKAELAVNQAKDETRQAIQTTTAQASAAQAAAVVVPLDNSLLKLSIDEHNQPCLDLDGQRVDTSQLAPEQRKRLIDLMVTMRPWIEGSIAKKPATTSSVTSRPIAVHTPSLSKPISSSGTAQTPPAAAPAYQPQSTPVVAASVIPLKEVAGPTTMVGQIDAILQAHLSGTPLASRKIRLIESLHGGVIVMVDRDRFESISDVPDAEILAAIRAAVAEWERKYTPGI